MSNCWLNLRFGTYHLQARMFADWGWMLRNRLSPVTWSHNPYQAFLRSKGDGWRPFEVMELRWPW
ncbi:hypothetical protein ACFB49_42910 [Sphingomonas sp. DBB INV C78]|uniref:hypothetical protein n=1 Tax=Sphingomonas sp. DBB INV C78 TaxID=3349434 RepID=UPI0036D3CAC4